ncbi:MAG: class I SAM-dependent methyltransferase [Chloroflexi bacterium]|nr:class I SAM-dependent methyltransferase [Chloroflexota bacterium]
MKRKRWTALLVAGLAIVVSALAVVLRRPREAPTETKGVSLDFMADYFGLMDRFLGIPFRQLTLRMAGIKEGDGVLDVGCGTGTLTLMEKDKVGYFGKVAGVDIGTRLIAKAQRRASDRHLDVDFRVASIDELPFPDGTFDVATSSGMTHHLPPDVKRAGFAEVYRALKPDGRYLIVDFSPSTGLWGKAKLAVYRQLAKLFEEVRYSIEVTEGKLPELLQQAGFADVEKLGTYRVGGFVPITFILARKK